MSYTLVKCIEQWEFKNNLDCYGESWKKTLDEIKSETCRNSIWR
jgi:hypothetical protein